VKISFAVIQFLRMLTLMVTALVQAPGVIVSEARIKSFPLSAEALGNAWAYEAMEVRAE